MTKVNSEAPHQHTSSLNLSSTSSTPTSDDASLVTNTIRCVQSNLRRSHQAQVNLFLDVLNKNVFKHGINVIFITEPHTVTKSNSLLDVPNDVFNIFSEKNGRTALVTKGITSWKVPQFCSKDIIVCQTKINNKLTFLVSLYLDCKVPSLPKELIDLMRNVGNNDVLIGTDSNAHSTVWNCSSTDNRGDMVNKFLIDNNLSCCNIGNNPTFENGSGDTSIIDLTIANYRLSQRIRNWQVEKVLHSTDHFRIRYDISGMSEITVVISSRYKKMQVALLAPMYQKIHIYEFSAGNCTYKCGNLVTVNHPILTSFICEVKVTYD